MRDYWQGRLHGKPCQLSSKEAGEMLGWALAMEPVFASAVDLVLQGPTFQNKIVSGACGYLLKDCISMGKLSTAIADVAAGGAVMSPSIARIFQEPATTLSRKYRRTPCRYGMLCLSDGSDASDGSDGLVGGAYEYYPPKVR